MTSPPAAAPPATQKIQSRQAGLRPPEKPLGTQKCRAYSEGMKVSFTCAAARAMSSPVAAA
jgi:hypothetical protein